MSKDNYKMIMNNLSDSSQAPRGPNIFYHCGVCLEYLPSQPDDNIGCKCSNIVIDIDYIRLMVKDFLTFTVVEQI